MRLFSQLEAQAAPILTPREEHRIPTKWTSYFLSAALLPGWCLRIGCGRDRLPVQLVVLGCGAGGIIGELWPPRSGTRRLEGDGPSLRLRFVRGRGKVEVAGDAGGGRLARFPGGSTRRQRPGLCDLAVRICALLPLGSCPDPGLGVDPPIPQDIASIIQAGREIAVVDLFLDQPVFHRPRLFLESGNLGLELFVLILEMAQADLHLARRRTAGQYTFSPRATRYKKESYHHPTGTCRGPAIDPGAAWSDPLPASLASGERRPSIWKIGSERVHGIL